MRGHRERISKSGGEMKSAALKETEQAWGHGHGQGHRPERQGYLGSHFPLPGEGFVTAEQEDIALRLGL